MVTCPGQLSKRNISISAVRKSPSIVLSNLSLRAIEICGCRQKLARSKSLLRSLCAPENSIFALGSSHSCSISAMSSESSDVMSRSSRSDDEDESR